MALEGFLDMISRNLMSVTTTAIPSLMVSCIRGYLQEAKKDIQEFEIAYVQYIRHLHPGEQGAAMQEMVNMTQR